LTSTQDSQRDQAGGAKGPKAESLGEIVRRTLADEPPAKGRILASLRRSPLVGADAIPPRPFETGRRVDDQ